MLVMDRILATQKLWCVIQNHNTLFIFLCFLKVTKINQFEENENPVPFKVTKKTTPVSNWNVKNKNSFLFEQKKILLSNDGQS